MKLCRNRNGVHVCALCYITACDSSEGMCTDRLYIILSGSLGAD